MNSTPTPASAALLDEDIVGLVMHGLSVDCLGAATVCRVWASAAAAKRRDTAWFGEEQKKHELQTAECVAHNACEAALACVSAVIRTVPSLDGF